MPTFPNVHAYLDNSELHPPKDFSIANMDTTLTKNIHGDLQWQPTYWQAPIKAIVDITLAPPTMQDGDRYVLIGNGTPHVSWGNVTANSMVQFHAPSNQWLTISPSIGYVTTDLAIGNTYWFNGTEWLKQQPDTTYCESVTYAQAQTLANNGTLTIGKNYWLMDKAILLTAASNNQFAIDAGHTREIRAYGLITLTTGSNGSVDAITINGVSLINGSVSFDTDLATTANEVANAIKANIATHGFTAFAVAGKHIILIAPPNLGDTLNGQAIDVNTTGIAIASANLTNGQAIGNNWFSIRYDFTQDKILAMADKLGNIVTGEGPSITQLAGQTIYDVFPWGYDNVSGNRVTNCFLIAFAATGPIKNNIIHNDCFVSAMVYTGGGISNNHMHNACNLNAIGANCIIDSNELKDQANLQADLSNGTINGNQLKNSTIVANNSSGTVMDNVFVNTANASLTNFSGTLSYNLFNGYTIALQNASGAVQYNTATGSGTLILTNYSGTGFAANRITGNTNLDASNASGTINDNSITSSTVTLQYYSGTGFTQNQLFSSTITANNATGNIAGNSITLSTMEANNATGAIQTNNINTYSTLKLNGFTGEKIINCQINDNSTLNAEGSPNQHGAILTQSNTNIDLTNPNSLVYQLHTFLPNQSVKFNSSFLGVEISNDHSTYSANTTIDLSGILAFDLDYNNYAGIIYISNSATINTITGLDKAPTNFIIIPENGVELVFNSLTATNIKLPISANTLSLTGNGMNRVFMQKTSDNSNVLILDSLSF